MQKGDITLEYRVLKTLIHSKTASTLKRRIINSVKDSFFSCSESKECWKFIKEQFLETNEQIPSCKVLARDPDFPSESKIFLKSSKYKRLQTGTDIGSAVNSLKVYSIRRALVGALNRAADSVARGDRTQEVVTNIENDLYKIRNGNKKVDDIVVGGTKKRKGTKKLLKHILSNKKEKLSPTGFHRLDDLLGGGTGDGDVITISANTGGGKTASVFNMFKYIYSVNHENVSLVELEMTNEELYQRLISNVSNMPYNKIRSHALNKREKRRIVEDWKAFEDIGAKHDCTYTMWSPKGDYDIHEVLAQLSGTKQKWVIIDYINLLAEKNESITEAQSLSKITRLCKRWAVKNKCRVVLLTQLDEHTKDIRYSRAIKEHSNIWLKWYYGEEDREQGWCEWELAKSRSSRLGKFAMNMELDYMRVTDKDYSTQKNYNNDKEEPKQNERKDDTSKSFIADLTDDFD